MNEDRDILGYTLLLTGNPAVGQEAAGYDRELKELTDMSQRWRKRFLIRSFW